ncbi:MAG: hypothetical protein FD130_1639, partial [Halothiobacillaceae bacterium]
QLALQEFVDQHRRLDIRQLRGAVQLDERYDHKRLRATGAAE